MIIGDFTKKPQPRDVYSLEFDPSRLNRGQRRAFEAYGRHEQALQIRHLRAQLLRQLHKMERLSKRAARQQKAAEAEPVPDEQTGEASITLA